MEVCQRSPNPVARAGASAKQAFDSVGLGPCPADFLPAVPRDPLCQQGNNDATVTLNRIHFAWRSDSCPTRRSRPFKQAAGAGSPPLRNSAGLTRPGVPA